MKLSKLLSIGPSALVATIVMLQTAVGVYASSWDPTVRVNTESFSIIDDGDLSSNVFIQFGDVLAETLTFDITASRFDFSDDVHVEGNITGSGTLRVESDASVKGDILLPTGGSSIRFSGLTHLGLFESGNGTTWKSPESSVVTIDANSNDTNAYFAVISDTTTVYGNAGSRPGDANTRLMVQEDGNVGIGTANPETDLEVIGNISGTTLQISTLAGCDSLDTDADGNVVCGVDSGGSGSGLSQSDGDARYVQIAGDTMTGALAISGAGLTVDGTAIFNEDGDTSNLRVESDNEVNMFFVHGTNDQVGIGTSTPNARLGIATTEDSEFIRLEDTTNADSVGIFTGVGTPEAVVTAQLGSLYIDNFTGILYKKHAGDGTNVGWEEMAIKTGSHLARMSLGPAQNIGSTREKILFDSETFDDGGIADPVTNDRFNINHTGSYIISASWTTTGDLDSSDYMETCIFRNGIVHGCSRNMSPSNNNQVTATVTDVLQLNQGDYIEMFAASDKSGGVNTNTAGSLTPYMSVTEIGSVGGGGGGGGGGISVGEADDRYVNVTGDSMSGQLLMDMNSNSIALDIDSEATSEAGVRIDIAGDSDSPHLLFGEGGIFDTNLFRDAADLLRTDDSFFIGGELTVNTLQSCTHIVTNASGTLSCGTATGSFISITTDEVSNASGSQYDIFEDANYTGTLDFVSNGAQDVSFSSTNGRFTISNTGAYIISLNLIFENDSSDTSDIYIQVNGATVYQHDVYTNPGGGQSEATFMIIRNLNANDYVEFSVDAANTSTATVHDGTTASFAIIDASGSGGGGGGGGGTLDDAYDADIGERTIFVDNGDVSWDLSGANDFIIDLQGTGFVGIDTASPETALDVVGTISGSNLNVSNYVTSDLVPSDDLTYTLGTPTNRWGKVYAEELVLSSSGTDTSTFLDVGNRGGVVASFKNGNAGVGDTITTGSLLMIDTSSGNTVILTTAQNDKPIGVAVNSTTQHEVVKVMFSGKHPIQCTGLISPNDLIQTSNTAGAAQAGNNPGKVIGTAISTCTGGFVDAIIHLE